MMRAATNASGDYKDMELMTRLEDTIRRFNVEQNNPLAGSEADPNYVPGYHREYSANTQEGRVTSKIVPDEKSADKLSQESNNLGLYISTPPATQPSSSTVAPVGTESVEYSYKPGDTFGQVLLNLGLSAPGQLWGPDGDVAYYTRQLQQQDMLDARGNVKLGKKFKLTRRPR